MRLRTATVLGLLLAVAAPAAAAPRAIAPMADADCRALADKVGAILGTRLAVTTGKPGEDSIVRDVKGAACLATATATGLNLRFDKADAAMAALFKGWKAELDLEADGPDSTVAGYSKGKTVAVYSLELEPPAGACDDVMPDECKVPRRQWVWTVGLIAFTYTGR